MMILKAQANKPRLLCRQDIWANDVQERNETAKWNIQTANQVYVKCV